MDNIRNSSQVPSKNLKELIKDVSDLYKTAKIIGTTIIIGGVLGLILALVASTPLLDMAGHEFIALTCLSAVFIVSACFLYAFLANLEYKLTVANQIANLKAFEKYLKEKNDNGKTFTNQAGG